MSPPSHLSSPPQTSSPAQVSSPARVRSPARVSSAPQACHEDHCITCGDDGVMMRVLAVDAASALADCLDEHGLTSTVDIALVDPVQAGEELLVHAGTAIARTGADG